MELLTTSEVAERLGVTIARVQHMIWAERLPAHKMGRDWFVKEADLALVSDRKPGRPPKPKPEAQPVGAAELKQPQPVVAGAARQGATNGAAQAEAKPKAKRPKKGTRK